MNRFVWPLVLFLAIAGLLWKGLSLNPRELPSTLISQPAPGFSLPILHQPNKQISEQTLTGEVWLLNVWASWCVACREEHPVITRLADHVDIVGLNYKDTSDAAQNWLARHGNPYIYSAYDQKGDVGIDYGVYGVPETFVIDQSGTIRYKHIGPVSEQDMQQKLLPIIASLKEG